MAHPTLFAILVAVGLMSIVQVVEMVVVGRDARGFSGINVHAVVPVVAAIALVTMVRAQEWRWAAGMAVVLAITLGQALLTLFGDTGYHSDDWLVGSLLWEDGTAGTEGPGGLLLRLAVSVPPMLWFALFGPARPTRPQAWRGLRHPALLLTVVVALAVSLIGAGLLDPKSHGSASVFGLIRPQQLGGSFRPTAVVGLGNVASTYESDGHNWATALWCAGWLALLVAAAVALVAPIRGRRIGWAVVVGTGVLASLVVGFVAGGRYYPDEQYMLAAYLAAMTGSAGAGVLAYALLGPRQAHG